MKRWTLAFAGFCAILIFSAYWIGLSPNKSKEQLNLWYVSGDFSADVMEELAQRYNLQRSSDYYKLVLRSFDTEDELAAAYGKSYPDLLLCSYSRAASLGDRNQLDRVSVMSFNYLPEIEAALPYAGESFFVLGSAVPVIVYNTELTSAPAETVSEFFKQAEEYYLMTSSPYFTCEEILPILSCYSAALGYELQGDLANDSTSEIFCSVYNSLAEQVMNSCFMPPTEDALSLVSQGLIPCAIVPSYRAADLSNGLSVSSLPLVNGYQEVYFSDLMGLAVTGANSYATDSCQAFVMWLRQNFSAMDALDLGLVPATANASAQSYSDLDSVLLDVYTGTPLVYSPFGEYMQNYQEIEAQLSHALDLLY